MKTKTEFNKLSNSDKWKEYERLKKQLAKRILFPAEYDKEIQNIVEKLGL